ncbi:molybdopterin-dependent oxidoreductase [Nocardiopsis sp. CNT-189]|uniref:molybdopterin-dependent oxidoreductase n=1 Tax=Nocardiopsis oceanisediminis TaxID=2816862 RepID=UPI003B2E3795
MSETKQQNRKSAPSARGAAAAVGGLVAAGAGLAAAEVATVPVGPDAAPLTAVGGAVIDLAPRPLKEFAVQAFGTADKAVLLGGMVAVLAVAAALLGVAARRRPWIGGIGAGALAAVAAAAALSRPDAGPLAVLPGLVGGAAAYLVLRLLLHAAGPPARPAEPERGAGGTGAEPAGEKPAKAEPAGAAADPAAPGEGFDRRRFVLLAGAAAAVSAGAAAGARAYTSRAGSGAEQSMRFALPRPASPARPVPDGADLEVAGLAPFFTPTEDFYRIDTALVVPRIDAGRWSLRLHGAGARETVFTFQDLLDRSDLAERDVTLTCVSNRVGGPYVGNARWIGVPLAALLREAGVRPPSEGGPADQLVSRSSDGMTIGTPVEDVMDGRDALLALGMNGRPLPADHGFPVRMVVPGLYGYVSACKWLTELELTTFDAFDAYWVPRGWSARGPIKVQSRIDTPRDGASAGPGGVTVAGVAWAQNTGIDRVEVRVDGGGWREARLAEEATADTWRQWVFDWDDAEPGEHALAVRATTADGRVQTAEEAPPAPDGATGHHEVRVTVA